MKPKALVIVESPLKAKAIQTYLTDDFEVYGSGGQTATPESPAIKEQYSPDTQKIYALIWSHAYAADYTDMPEFKIEPTIYSSVDGKMAVLVQTLTLTKQGFYWYYPQARDDLYRLYADARLFDKDKKNRIRVLGIRQRGFPVPTPSNLLRLMQQNGLGRPSTFAEHLGKLTGIR